MLCRADFWHYLWVFVTSSGFGGLITGLGIGAALWHQIWDHKHQTDVDDRQHENDAYQRWWSQYLLLFERTPDLDPRALNGAIDALAGAIELETQRAMLNVLIGYVQTIHPELTKHAKPDAEEAEDGQGTVQ